MASVVTWTTTAFDGKTNTFHLVTKNSLEKDVTKILPTHAGLKEVNAKRMKSTWRFIAASLAFYAVVCILSWLMRHTFRSKWFNRFDWQKQQQQQLLQNQSASTTITTVMFGRPRATVARPTQDSCSYTVGNRVVNANMGTISLNGLDGSPWSFLLSTYHCSLLNCSQCHIPVF